MVTDLIMNLVYVLLFGAIFVLFGYYFLVVAKYKHKVRVKEICNGRMVITDVKAKEHKDKDKNITWKLSKFRREIPVPSNEVIEIDSKGKKLIEIYLTETGEVFFAQDKAKIIPYPQTILDIKDLNDREIKKLEWMKLNNKITPYEPYGTEHRYFQINQTKKADAMRKKSWQEHIPLITSMMALVLIIAMLLIFYGEIAAPVLEAREIGLSELQIKQEMLILMETIQGDIQVIKSEAKILPKDDNEVIVKNG